MVREISKTLSHKKSEKKLCLCMIVKNESKIIERCLDSAKSIIDFVSICDTGSTDRTPEIIRNWCNKNNILGTVHHEPFKNFGYNRTLAVQLAQATYPEADYLLLLDADMILEVQSDFDKCTLNKDHYLTMQYDSNIKYWLSRLLKTSLPWASVGVTHEYWDIDYSKLGANQGTSSYTTGKLDSLIIYDQADGGSRSDKFERDKRLLLEGINNQSTPIYLKVRYMFYLAQTLSILNELEEAIIWYKKRVDAGGWEEEVFYSLFKIGLCYERLADQCSFKREQLIQESIKENSVLDQSIITNLVDQEEQFFALATIYLQNSWEYRPSRAEPLYHLAKLYRYKSKNNVSLMYALHGKEIPFPKDDILFVDYHVYDYLFDYEISICAYYNENKRNLGRTAQKCLEAKIKQLPPNIASYVEQNTKFYE
ncbi:glycosyltransferase family 2 protein [Bacillus sp. BP-3]|uniref:glycosyltransferase family 2 protein n=1 Tax=Bacillus sp. BP-3 TaxID=3022773 RepID=UPI00232EE482|nr:glycosyltransferase family 2 protein [Bacillus sp. BP-3]MDC2863950.1 glycosyltransferase family 2 protein [Bacillus sp. BP-3]